MRNRWKPCSQRTRKRQKRFNRLTAALREGRESHEEFRLLKPLGRSSSSGSGAHWYRLKARILQSTGQKQPFDVWQLSDITAERDDQERFFPRASNAY